MLKKVIRQTCRLAGFEVVRARREPFRWSHTVEDYYPIVPKPRWDEGGTPHTQLKRIRPQSRCV
jgi:hypothetical protein